jgi:hypothetical protein
VCLDGACRPALCFIPLDCGSGAICHENRCRSSCATDADCRQGQACTAAGTCADPAACDPPCGNREYCEEATLTCQVRGCAIDDDCIATEICIGVECVEGCRTDEACGINAICQAQVCVAGCRNDQGCTDIQVCAGGQCVLGCNDDSDCRLGDVCLGEACRTGCRDDSSCPEGQRCEGAAGASPGQCEVPPCDDDDLEPNDTVAQGSVVESAVATPATACPSNDDWFVVAPETGCVVVVELAFSDGDLTFDIVRDGSSMSADPTATDEGLGAEVYVGRADELAVLVSNLGLGATDYAVTITTSCLADLTCPDDDTFEDNDDPAAATFVDELEVVAGIVCEADADFYALGAPVGCTLSADLEFSHADADLNLALLADDGTEFDASVGSTDSESVSALVVGSGPTVVRVDRAGAGSARYVLTFDLDCAAVLTCPANDGYEPNDTLNTATALGHDLSLEGILCEGDRDCFEVTPVALCLISADLSFANSAGDLGLVLVDSGGRVLDESRSADDLESVSAMVDPLGSAFVCVEHQGSGSNRYTLEAHAECVGCPDNDTYEPNNHFDEATELELGRTYLGVECATGSSDYFHFVAPGDCEIRAEMVSDFEYDIELYTVGAPYQLLAANVDVGGTLTLVHPAQGGEDYWFRIWPFGLEIDNWTYTFEVTCD